MDKYDEVARKITTNWISQLGPTRTIAAALRESAADAYDTMAESIEEAKKMPGIDMSPLSKALRGKSSSLRALNREGNL